MPYRTLGRTGVQVTSLALGAMNCAIGEAIDARTPASGTPSSGCRRRTPPTSPGGSRTS
ncbi:hypothetical protein [Streptomyces phaeoluteigriseus]|uniref:hypothetical protein n=1 Tax=Streptomyces phaeoluteigriseus TaxID=114686 RepID=UPI0026CA4096